jgi:hypothetical protein
MECLSAHGRRLKLERHINNHVLARDVEVVV